MKMSLPLGFLFTVVTLTISLFTACGRSPLVRPETSASQTEIAAETGEAISPVVAATKLPETPTSTPSPTATVQTSLVSETDASPSSEPSLTPTTKPLSPLDERLGTIVFSTVGEKGPEIWRVQVNEQGQKAGPAERVDFPTNSRIDIYGLFLSPDKRYVAVGWVFGTGATHVSILDISTGQLAPLFGEADIDQRVTFLDWTPDGQEVLVIGGDLNPDFGNSAWLVNVNTHVYQDVNIKQVKNLPRILDASFSPDGKMIAYTHKNHVDGSGEIWRLNLDDSSQQLLYKYPQARIENVLWSPDGNYIAFTQWIVDVGSFPVDEFGLGELHLIRADGSKDRVLNSIAINFENQPFCPIWSPDSRQIAFVKSNSESDRNLEQFSSNIYTINILSNQVKQLTNYQNTQVIKPMWSPDGSSIAFLTAKPGQNTQFQMIRADERKIHSPEIDLTLLDTLSESQGVQSHNLGIQTPIIWLP